MTLKAIARIPFFPVHPFIWLYTISSTTQDKLKVKFTHIHLCHIFHFVNLLFLNTFPLYGSQFLTPPLCHPLNVQFALISLLCDPFHYCVLFFSYLNPFISVKLNSQIITE